MLDNEFDQIFRDRLLDHPSNVRQGLWKQLHTHMVRHNAFLKWYFVGPSAIAAAVAGYFLVTAIHSASPSPAAKNPQSSTATTAPVPASTPAQGSTPTLSSPETAPAATPATAPVASSDPASSSHARSAAVAPGSAPATAKSSSHPHSTTQPYPDASSASASLAKNHRHRSDGAHASAGSNSTNAGLALSTDADLAADGGVSGSNKSTLLSSAGAGANTQANTAPHPPIPAQLTAQAKLAALKTRPDVAAKTVNPKNPHQLILPVRLPRRVPPVHIDAFGAPEYYALKTFGLSYAAGARVTMVFKRHWTLTTGLQYLRTKVVGNTKDSINYLSPGSVKNLHIPILVGYTTGNDHFTFSANAGILMSAFAHAEGKFTETADWPNRNGTSAYLGLDFGSKVTDKMAIFAQPYLKSWYPLYHTPFPQGPLWSTGIMLGLRYGF